MMLKKIELFLILCLVTLTSIAHAQATARVWTSTTDLSHALSEGPALKFRKRPFLNRKAIVIDDSVVHQTIVGLGSSLEPTTCYNLSLLPEDKRREAVRKIVHPIDGAGMNLMRICIGTPDFTGDPWYTYHDKVDPELKSFSIEKDQDYILPILKMALEENPDLKFFASPWSPPGWMTSTGDMIGGTLLPKYYEAYARYFVKFIEAYTAAGIPIHAVTIQNEPGVDRSLETDPKWFYPSCRWNGEQEAEFIGNHLGPLFEKAGIEAEIWSYDHNYNTEPSAEGDDPGISYPRTVLSNPNSSPYVDKVAFHGYVGTPKGMKQFQNEFPNTPVLFTEGSKFGLRGAMQIIDLFQHDASSYNAWVTIIDENKGPNNGPFEASKTCIMLDTKKRQLTYHFDYYMYGHFMRYIQPGAKRIQCVSDINKLSVIAFKNPDETITFIAVNANKKSVEFSVQWQGQSMGIDIESQSIMTLTWPTP